MKTKNAISYLINSYKSVFNNTINNFSCMALVVILATGGTSGTFMVTPDIAVAQTSRTHFNVFKEGFFGCKVLVEVLLTIEIHPKSSLFMDAQDDWMVPIITDGTNLVIHITRTKSYPPAIPTINAGRSKESLPCLTSDTAGPSIKDLWLEIPQKGLDINANEITITEWSKLAFFHTGQEIYYFSPNGSGILKIRKQGTSFHGTARFNFTDPSYEVTGNNPDEYVDWTF